jgi:FlaA1/EpsC-like NDP-sugar epimerase
MIKRFFYIFLSKSPIYLRKITLIIVDMIFISISYIIGLFFSKAIFNIEFYFFLLITTIFVYFFTGQYKSITRYLDNKSLFLLSLRSLGALFCISFLSNIYKFPSYENITFIYLWVFISLSLTFVRVIFKDLVFLLKSINLKNTKVAIYGAGEAGNQLLNSLRLEKRFKVIYFFDDSEIMQNRFINGIPIKDPKNIGKYNKNFEQLFIAIPSLNRNKMRNLLNSLPDLNMPVLQIPSIEEISSGKASINSLKPISIENILGRDPITPNLDILKKEICNKVVCVTGAGGSIGSEICRQIVKLNPSSLIMLEISEYALYTIQQEINTLNPDIKVYSVLGNMVNMSFMEDLFRKKNINIVFHAAAYKHVPLVEENPFQGIHNNINSTINLCKVVQKYNVDHALLISSDKAVRPTNFMGASKRIAELIFQGFSSKIPKTKFCIVRFGNVLGSSGSVVPKFCNQISDGGPVTITHPEITRYFMTIKEATLLVIHSLSLSEGADILLLDMGTQLKIKDLAIKMIRLSGLTIKDQNNINGDIEIIYSGLRPGEKLYEELLIDAKAKKTDHPKIFRAIEKSIKLDILMEKLKELEDAIFNNNLDKLIFIIKDIVPEWNSKNYN